MKHPWRRNPASSDIPSMEQPRLDRLLSRTANASQVGLLILAVFGYFYTVLPVYQKSLLDEEIAKKTLEIGAKEKELQAKTAELTHLNDAVAQARETAKRAEAEAGKLRGTVREQYVELRYRLMRDFQMLGSKLCKLSKIPDGAFSDCIRKDVLPIANLAALSARDKALIQALVDGQNESIRKDWREFRAGIERQKQQVEAKNAARAAACDARKSSDEYKDRNGRIKIDYECNIDSINANTDLIKVEMESLYSGEDFLSSRLAGIVQTFFTRTEAQ